MSLQHSWSPDGSKLALATRFGDGHDAEIVIVDVQSGQATALTQNETNDRSPAFSPDGNRLAYVGSLGLAVVDLPSGNTTTADVPAAFGTEFQPAAPSWSPDGTRIAFTTRWLYVVDARNGRATRPSETEVSTFDAPAWSPDGRRIAVVSRYTGSQDLFVINVDGSGETRFPDPRFERSPTWAPSERLAFLLGGEIHTMSFDGSGRRAIALPGDWSPLATSLQWSPDGDALALSGAGSFVTSCSHSEIYTVSSADGEVKNLTVHPAVDFDPRWVGDGRRISFQADSRSIYVMDRDGANVVRIWPNRSVSRTDPEYPRPSPHPIPPPPHPIPPPPPQPLPPPDPERATLCAANWLRFRGVAYHRRELRGLRPAALLGVGTYFRCREQALTQVRVRRILGVPQRRAVAVSRTIYVSATCAGRERVLRCLDVRRQR